MKESRLIYRGCFLVKLPLQLVKLGQIRFESVKGSKGSLLPPSYGNKRPPTVCIIIFIDTSDIAILYPDVSPM